MTAALQLYQGFISPFVRPGIVFLTLVGLWVGLRRAQFDSRTRVVIWLIVTSLLLAWYLAMDQMGRSGFLQRYWDIMRPLCWTVALIWLSILVRSNRVAAVLDAIPPWWLIALQVYRALGGAVWLMTWATGRLSGLFGMTAGIGDSLVGVLALPAAFYILSGRRGGYVVGTAWNVFGIIDFAIGFGVAFILPYKISYPAIMIPAFLAPLSLIFHGLSLWQLNRATRLDV